MAYNFDKFMTIVGAEIYMGNIDDILKIFNFWSPATCDIRDSRDFTPYIPSKFILLGQSEQK